MSSNKCVHHFADIAQTRCFSASVCGSVFCSCRVSPRRITFLGAVRKIVDGKVNLFTTNFKLRVNSCAGDASFPPFRLLYCGKCIPKPEVTPPTVGSVANRVYTEG